MVRAQARKFAKQHSPELDKLPKSGAEKLKRRLSFASYAQLSKWGRRCLARGNRLLDYLDEHPEIGPKLATLLEQQVNRLDILGTATNRERANRRKVAV